MPSLTDKLHRAKALHQAGQLRDARAIYEDVLRVQPRQFEALHLSGILAAQMKNPRKAVELIEKALTIDPNNAVAYCDKATALQELQQWDAALASYDRAIALQSGYALAHCNRGTVLRELGQLDAALASYDRALVGGAREFRTGPLHQPRPGRGALQSSHGIATEG